MTPRSFTPLQGSAALASPAARQAQQAHQHATSPLDADEQAWGDIPHTPWATAQACVDAADSCEGLPAQHEYPAVDQAEEDLRFSTGAYLALCAALVGSALAAAWWPWGFAPVP